MKTWMRSVAAVALVMLVCVASAIGQPISAEQKQEILDALKRQVDRYAYTSGVDFAKLPEVLEKNREALDKAVDVRAFNAAVNGALKGFGISHLRVLSPQVASTRNSTTRVGVGISTRKTDDGLLIQDVIEGGPAEGAGVRSGDLIIKIDGQPASATEALGGDEGTKVVLTLRREDKAEEDVSVTRGKFSTRKPETLVIVEPGVAVLRIPTFSVGYDLKNIEALFARVKKENIKELVLDLRGNGGGRVSNLSHLLGFFLPRNTEVGTRVSRALAKQYTEATGDAGTDALLIAKWAKRNYVVRATQENRFTGKVAVLIDRGSASASEITAAALRELRDAPLIGTPSAGAVLVSSHRPLAEGWEVQIPLSDYVTVKGVRLEAHKLKPDVEAKGPRAKDNGMDEAVRAALKKLREAPNSETKPAEEVNAPAGNGSKNDEKPAPMVPVPATVGP
jgi:carboxyl-terminal processing protease